MSTSTNTLYKKISSLPVDDKNMLSLIHATREGIKFPVFMTIARQSPFDLQRWSSFLHLSLTTMLRYQKKNRRFDSPQSERIIQIALVYKKGLNVFGDKEKFYLWLETKNRALGKTKPMELLDNAFGITMLTDELSRIEHGVLA